MSYTTALEQFAFVNRCIGYARVAITEGRLDMAREYHAYAQSNVESDDYQTRLELHDLANDIQRAIAIEYLEGRAAE